MNLVSCECGWSIAGAEQVAATREALVKLCFPAMLDHWRAGHKLTARGTSTYRMVRQSAILFAQLQGHEVDEAAVPDIAEPPRRSPFDFDADPLIAAFREAMRRRHGGWNL